jgi:hypothetical protein
MKTSFLLSCAALMCAAVFAQTAQEAGAALPRGYGNITFGMTKAEVQDALTKNPAFGYRGERDVSLLPSTRETIIETPGIGSVFGRAWFQFSEDRLSIITISLNPAKVDRFSVFTTLVDKYGKPHVITPQKSEWRNDEVVLTLESPLTLKYVDARVFDRLAEQTTTEQTVSEQSYQQFLEGL